MEPNLRQPIKLNNQQTFLKCYCATPNAALLRNKTLAEPMLNRKLQIVLNMIRPLGTDRTSGERNEKAEKEFNRSHGVIG